MAARRMQTWLAFSSTLSISRWHGDGRLACSVLGSNRAGGRKPRTRSHITCSAVQSTAANADNILRRSAHEQGLDHRQINSLLRLADLLLSENKRYNLTAIRTRDAVLLKHIVDALSLLPVMDMEKPENVIDVGTGGGFPGLVLAIARPNWHVTLLDSARKKTRFHGVVGSELQLENIASVWARAEEAGQNRAHREKYNVVVARSVAEMRVLCELCLPLVSVNGCFLAQKSVDESQCEILGAGTAIKILGGSLEAVSKAWPAERTEMLKGEEEDNREKSTIVIRKKSKTPSKYPRLPGVPKKTPLS